MHWLDTVLVTVNALVITLFNMAIFVPYPELHQFLKALIPIFLYVFVCEEMIRIIVFRGKFFKDHRNLFVVAVLVAAVSLQIPDLTILLLFNSLRALRLLSSPKTRHVIDTLFHSIPGAMNLLLLILIAYFIFAVLATNLYGEKVPELWGTIPQSLLSLQQIMLGDDWGNNLRATLKFYPYAWIFSTAFLIVVTFILLNVFIGVIVDAMQTAEEEGDSDSDLNALKKEIKMVRKDIEIIKQAILKE
ncbi:ion transporter [Candidatus Paracaedibacter symbiosus]|uniref:ion transporter n=1 Tax=Candidatus Paracaedibacter symbiosus TaxID=244582 RepID=UPI00050984A6|nr:ion transporter [Candidatus Paracaedibacter symbiosus]